jgi:hypothetical protein
MEIRAQGLAPDATSGGPYLHTALDVILTDGCLSHTSQICQEWRVSVFLKVTKGCAD